MIAGSVMLTVDLLLLHPMIAAAGGLMVVAGAAVMLRQCGFFTDSPLGGASDERPAFVLH